MISSNKYLPETACKTNYAAYWSCMCVNKSTKTQEKCIPTNLKCGDMSTVEQYYFQLKRIVLQQHQVTVTVIYMKSNPLNIFCFFIQSFEQCHQHSVARHCRSRSTANLRLDRHHGLFLPPAQNTTSTHKKSRRLPNGIHLTHTSSCW